MLKDIVAKRRDEVEKMMENADDLEERAYHEGEFVALCFVLQEINAKKLTLNPVRTKDDGPPPQTNMGNTG